MKTVLKFITMGLIFAAFGGISVSSTFAQTAEECDAIYQKFLKERKGPGRSNYQAAIASGKEYLDKCKAIEGGEEVKSYVEKQLPKLDTTLADLIWDEDVIQPFNKSVPAKSWDVTFDKGRQVLAKNPDFIDVMLVLASVGFDQAAANNDKFNAETVNMAKLVLQKMNEGKPSVTGDFGAFAYRYKTTKCTDGRVNATGWMNYTIGYINFYRQKNPKEAAPYLYKALQVGCETKTMGDIYRMIGSWYIDEFKKIDDERIKKIEANGGKDNEETISMLALERGYMERIIDAYARASKLATTPANKDAWLNRAKDIYKLRFDNDMSGFDKWVADSSAKAFADPASTVTPVVVQDNKAPSTTGMSAVSNDSTTGSTADTRPRTADTKTVSPNAATAAKAATTKKAPAKKPAPKKKGTL